MNPLILKAATLFIVAAALMVAGAMVDHHLYVVPLRSAIDKQSGASAQASHDAIVAVKTTTESQNATTIQSAKSFDDISVRADSAISRMQRSARTDKQHLPSASVSSGESSATICQSFGSCEDSGDPVCTITREFFDGAIKDSIGVDGHVQWEDAQHFPIQKE